MEGSIYSGALMRKGQKVKNGTLFLVITLKTSKLFAVLLGNSSLQNNERVIIWINKTAKKNGNVTK